MAASSRFVVRGSPACLVPLLVPFAQRPCMVVVVLGGWRWVGFLLGQVGLGDTLCLFQIGASALRAGGQVEMQKGVLEVEAITAVDGVDCIQKGPLDLSACLGYLWDSGHRKVREVMAGIERRVPSKSGDGGAYLSGFAEPHDPLEEMKKRGYHMVAEAVDLGMFRKAAMEDVLRFHDAPGFFSP